QAEDGLGVFHVTGVQTCAFPISPRTVWNQPGGLFCPACGVLRATHPRTGAQFTHSRSQGVSARFLPAGDGELSARSAPLVVAGRSEVRRVWTERRTGLP